MDPYAAVILAGGAARRFGGVDKPMLRVHGRPMLHRVLGAVPDAADRIVVGPPTLDVPEGVRRVREEPPGGGPVAAAAAGLSGVAAPTVALLAADLPFLDPAAIRTLRAALAASDPREAGHTGEASGPGEAGHPGGATPVPRGAGRPGGAARVSSEDWLAGGVVAPGAAGALPLDGVVFLDRDGKRQTLCGIWRTGSLLGALARVGPPAGVPLRVLLAGLRVGEVPAGTGGPPPWYDCDEPDDLQRAEEWT